MKARLLYRDQDFDWLGELPWNQPALEADLALDTLFAAMAQGDSLVLSTAQKVILASVNGNFETILYRQAVLADCLKRRETLRQLYQLAGAAVEKQRKRYLGTLARYPHWVLADAIGQMDVLSTFLRQLRQIADRDGSKFSSDGWRQFFSMVRREIDEPFLAQIAAHLTELGHRDALLFSARLGAGCKAEQYALHRLPRLQIDWWSVLWQRIRAYFRPPGPSPNGFAIHPRDEAGARALELLRDQAIASAATTLAGACEHVRNFFSALVSELAFYVGCVNLHDALTGRGEPVVMPLPLDVEDRHVGFRGLYDAALALTLDKRVVGNDLENREAPLVVVTGANQGGKSTFLRSLGLAQLMMQSGMFVAAESFSAAVARGVFTHYKREEDIEMESGKFDEELRRINEIIDHLHPHAFVLFNESFASTNEQEGSEIARQIVAALQARSVRVAYVTHLYELAHGLFETDGQRALFMRAERLNTGQRTFRLIEGEPLRTSFGEDLYNTIFGADPNATPQLFEAHEDR